MTWFHNNVLLPLCEPDRYRNFGRRLRELERFESLTRNEQLTIQEQRVLAILDHAYHNCPYYRLVFDEMCFRASDWRQGLPLPLPELTRDLVRTNSEDIPARSFRPAQLRRVSGTAGGAPVVLWHDIGGLRNKTALEYHLHQRAGLRPGMRVLSVQSSDSAFDRIGGRRSLLTGRILKRVTCGTASLNEALFRDFQDKLNLYRPDVICGDLAALARCASWLAGSGDRWHKPLLVIATTASPDTEDRWTIQQILDCEVRTLFRGRDIGIAGHECREGNRLHLHPAACYVELMPAGQSPEGTLYRLLLTDLLNYGMPLIRYDTGTSVRFDESPCPCGSTYPSVTAVPERRADNLILPDGTLLDGAPLVERTFRTLRQVQLIQKSVDRIHVRYSALGQDPAVEQDLARFLSDVEDAFRAPIQWTIERLAEIPRDSSGRLRTVICEVSKEQYAPAWKRAG